VRASETAALLDAPTPVRIDPSPIAFVVGQGGSGGTELQSQLLVRALLERGLEVDVFVVEGGGSHDFGSATVHVLTGGRRVGVRGVWRTASAAWRLGVALRRRHYAVVHAAMARAYVLTALTCPRRSGMVAWRRNLGIHSDARWWARWLERLAVRNTSAIVANSSAVARYWVEERGIPASRVSVVPNALPEWRFGSVPPAPSNGAAVRLVCVGNLRPVKGHEVLIEAAAVLQSSYDVEVVVLGEGSARTELEALASDLGVRLCLPGEVADPRPWLASASVYAHPSRSEGSSNAVAEAMAQGCAIVCTDVGGARELVGDTALLVPPGDASALAGAIGTLLEDPATRRDLGARARARAGHQMSVHHMVARHLDIYRSA